MSNKRIKFCVALAIILISIGYLVKLGIDASSVYYMTVDELISKKSTFYEEDVRVQGKVVDGTINKSTKTLKLIFDLADEENNSSIIKVNYTGIVPDLFKAGIDVVIEGRYTKDNVFNADILLTSCPSKYEESGTQKFQKGETI